jgi:hypothetical protein
MTKNYNDLGVEFKYLIVNDMDQKYGLWVNTVGFQSIQPNSPYPLKDHPTDKEVPTSNCLALRNFSSWKYFAGA